MQKYFTIGLLLIFINDAISQNTDSLRRMPGLRQNQEKADLLLALSKSYWYTKRDTALFYAAQALQFSREISYARGVAEAYRHMGVISMVGVKAQIAEPFLDTALKLFRNIQDTTGMAATLNNIGVLLSSYLGRYQESIIAFEQALALFRKLGNSEGEGSVLNYMGLNYEAQGNYQGAIDCTLQGLEIRKKITDIPGVMYSLTRVGDMYQAVGQNETASKYYMEALNFAREKKAEPLSNTYAAIAEVHIKTKQYEEAKKYIDLALGKGDTELNKGGPERYYMLLARLYMETGMPEKALTIYKQAMVRAREGPDYPELASCIMGISKAYQLKKDYPAAMKYAKNAYEIASKHNIRWIIADAANSLSSFYAFQGNYRKAYAYEKIHRSISDSVNMGDSHRKLAFLESKNEIEKKQSSIELLNKENQIKEQRLKKEALSKKILVGGIAVILLVAFVLFRNVLLKRKNERHRRELAENELQLQKLQSERATAGFQQQKTELEMQALRSQMNPHFIFNSLNSINRFILQNNRTQASEYLTKFSKLVRMILQNSQASLINLESELESLELYLELEALRFNYHFNYKISVPKELDIEMLKVPPLIIQPYVENAIWHGLMHKEEKGQLDIEVSSEDDHLYFKITDNGIGRKQAAAYASKSATKHKSMGLRITSHRIAMMQRENGTESPVTINDLVNADGSAAGTEIIIKIPLIDN